MSDARTILIAGTRLDLLTRRDVLDTVAERLEAAVPRPCVVASSNLDHIHHFGTGGRHTDPAKNAVTADWIVTADGMPIVWAARSRTRNRWPQLAGSDLLPEMLDVASRCGATVGFLGGWPDQHDALRSILPTRFHGLDVRGYWSPSQGDLANGERARQLAQEVAAAGVELLVVGLGKPRQELWLAKYAVASEVKVALAFGAAADFLTGSARRAPPMWRRVGLEWLYRLLREPGRLWRRYLVHGPVAIWRVFGWPQSRR